jgi:diguanylate cyclase (GGDEF)-like protein/PAS domain S-box-containing protein
MEERQSQPLVLVVEDSPTQSFQLVRALEGAGFRVLHATNGHEALEQARRCHPDIIVSDVLMPGMDGFMLCREVRRDKALASVPLLLYTSTFINPQDDEFAQALGATAFLLKPRDPREVATHIRDFLAQRAIVPAAPGHMVDDATFVQRYGERLSTTLELKVAELEAANMRLLQQHADVQAARDHLAALLAEQERTQAALQHERDLMNAILGTIGALVVVLDHEGRIVSFNRACEQLSGYQFSEVQNCRFWEIFPAAPEEADPVKVLVENLDARLFPMTFEHTWFTRSRDCRLITGTTTVLCDASGVVTHIIAAGLDITERKAFENQLAHQAIYDTLTDLPNRILFLERVSTALARAQRQQGLFAVLSLNLDRFKLINESLGRAAGDQVLLGIAERLACCLRSADMVARLGWERADPVTIARVGGDEFGVLLEDLHSMFDATRVAERLKQKIEVPLTVKDNDVVVTVSIGIALSSPAYQQAEHLIRDAGIALSRAKARGRARSEVFDPTMNANALERLKLEVELRHALEYQEFRVYYQPKVDLTTGQIIGLEALVRWEHPQRGLVSPALFVPLAEETGLILTLGQWVLETACRQIRTWQMAFPQEPPLFVCVNLSARQFQRPWLVDEIVRVLEASQLTPSSLILEITESVVMQDGEGTIAALTALKGLGVRLAIDDFGTGYSSLAYLQRFPIDILKIDRSFVHGVGSGKDDIAIVQAVITLAKTMHLDVTAEGIETDEQLTKLQALGCTMGQGYYFARPLPSEAVAALLAERPRW